MADPVYHGDFRILPEERAKELESAEKNALQLVVAGNAQLRAAREEIEMLRRALEWYADRSNWRSRGLIPMTPAHEDKGRRARKVLGIGGG